MKKLSLKVWDNLGRVMGETFRLADMRRRAMSADCEFDGLADILGNKDRGIVFASGHLGPYELMVMAGHIAGFEPAGIYQELSNPLVDQYLADQRSPMFPGGLLSKSHKTARKVLGIVKAGGSVAILADLREFKGIEIEFFGQSAYCNPFPALLARHCDVPFVGARVIRRHDGSFTFNAEEITVPRSEDNSTDIRQATQNFHDLLERYIREYPEQWMWTHRKWAQPPPTKT